MDITSYASAASSGILNVAKLKEAKLKGKQLTITEVNEETIGETLKPVVRFKETELGLGLNKTNAKVLLDAFGKDTDQWKGKKISLNTIKITFEGEIKDSIQVEIPEE